MPRYERNLAVLAKIETTYGTDSVPTGALNAILAVNAKIDPLVGEEVGRELSLPYMGHQGVMLVGSYARVTLEVEIAGSGAAGTAPKVGPLLRSCAWQEVITAGVDVQYTPVSKQQEAATLYFYLDGVRHALLGARGNVKLSKAPLRIPRFVFELSGLLGPITDVVIPALTLTGFIKPVPVNKANTTLSLHGHAGPCEGLDIDLGNQIEPRFLINSESIEHVDRISTGSVVLEATLLATKNWFAIAQAHTTGTLAVQHGTQAGNIVMIDAPAVQIGRPTYGASQKIVNNSLPLMFLPNAGNDEIKLTFK